MDFGVLGVRVYGKQYVMVFGSATSIITVLAVRFLRFVRSTSSSSSSSSGNAGQAAQVEASGTTWFDEPQTCKTQHKITVFLY